MNKFIKRILLLTLVAVLLAVCAPIALADAAKKPLSPAFNVIASKRPIVLSAQSGEKITFSEKIISESLGINSLSGLVITSLPAESSGKLMLGSLRVTRGQKITESSLSSLSFVPNKGTEAADFTFTVGGEYTVKAVMYFLEGENYSPTSAGIDESFFELKTYKNIAVSGRMRCSDPENDAIFFEVVSIPEKGLLSVKDRESGEYTYTPMKNYIGNDSFSYVAVDKYGNRSNTITVDISVSRSENGTVFKDMIFDSAHYGAILLDDLGIMEGRTDEGDDVFMPDKTVSYGSFIKSAIQAANIPLSEKAGSEISEAVMNLPSEYRAYILTAYDFSLIGAEELKTLNCDRTLTKAEACFIIDGLLGTEDVRSVPAFNDIDKVPSFALDAVCTLIEIGVVYTENGCIQPTDALNRADAAQMLAAVVNRI